MFECGIPAVDLFVKERSCSVRLEVKLEDGREVPCVVLEVEALEVKGELLMPCVVLEVEVLEVKGVLLVP